MSVAEESVGPEVPPDVETPDLPERNRPAVEAAVIVQNRRDEEEQEEEVFEDASEDGEVFIRRREAPRLQRNLMPQHQPARQTVSTPNIRPEGYDGTTDWSEYLIYFGQLAELYGWEEERKAMILGVCLKGEARVVLASLDAAQRHSYLALTTALSQSFAPKELVHLYQAELKARRKKGDESMVDLGRDLAKLVRLAYPTADTTTREVIGINAFLEALPGPASEMKLHVIKGRPRNLQEAVAHATEVDAVIEAESRKTSRRRGDVRMVGSEKEDLRDEMEKLKKDLEKTQSELREAKRDAGGRKRERIPLGEITCFGCGEKGHYRRNCPTLGTQSQGNGARRLDQE